MEDIRNTHLDLVNYISWNKSLKELDPQPPVLQVLPCKAFQKQQSRKKSVYSWPSCSSCEISDRRKGSSDCAFKDVRAASMDGTNVYYGYFGNSSEPKFPGVFSTALPSNIGDALRCGIADSLFLSLREELQHIESHHTNLLIRKRDLRVREVCDICRMCLFGASWFCRHCGRDLCSRCYGNITENNDKTSSCTSVIPMHFATDFIPCTRFPKDQIISILEHINSIRSSPTPKYYLPTQAFYCKEEDIIQSKTTCQVIRVPEHRLRVEEFRLFLSKRLPLVITGLNSKLQLAWSPTQLSSEFGKQYCTMEDCEGRVEPRQTSLEHFLVKFESTKGSDTIWKVKDWPPQAHISDSHPDLFKDFTGALPMPIYTKRDGVLNLAAHYPTNCDTQPDLGPKVYMALASIQDDDHSGSTRLHCDLCDAFNIMVFASPATGTALWHIFKASDSAKIRAYIRDAFKCDSTDPIHSQQFYLGPSHLSRLRDEHDVVPFIIHQTVGEAVYIPAGCAHQVSNAAHCIKVATDFLPVEALLACKALQAEFRNQNLEDAWREDVLQLNAQIYYAWISLQRPLEQARASFSTSTSSDNPGKRQRTEIEEENGTVEHQDDKKRPKKNSTATKDFRCPHCPPDTKSFFKHGIVHHLNIKHGISNVDVEIYRTLQ